MGNEGDLWDDSALIHAFDDAMAKYKQIHNKKNQDSLLKRVDVSCAQEKSISAPDGENHEAAEEEVNGTLSTNFVTSLEETDDDPPVRENPGIDVSVHGPNSSNGMPVQDTPEGHSYFHGTEGYDQLLAQYYDLEDKRAKILQQLQEYGYWNYQFPQMGSASGVQCANASTFREPALPPVQSSQPPVYASQPVDFCSCCPYVCQSFIAPCPVSACSFGKTGVDPICTSAPSSTSHQKAHFEHQDITRTAMEAAEKALSSLKLRGSTMEEEKGVKQGGAVNSASSETDLTAVLNAWYSAGFYTGKYLMEQSDRQKWQD